MSGSEILVVLVVALLLFGGKRMPEFARAAGRVMRDFHRAWEEFKRQVQVELDQNQPPPSGRTPAVGSAPLTGEAAIPPDVLEKSRRIKKLVGMLEDASRIPAERLALLEKLAQSVAGQIKSKGSVELVFVCTHNSRRSQMAQAWAAAAARRYGVSGVNVHSAGTEATAFNPRAVKALQDAGFAIEARGSGANPVYEVTHIETEEPLRCWSKALGDPALPKEGFIAVMTCDQAAEACPVIPGAAARLSLTYPDPGRSDGTPQEEAEYRATCARIAREMGWVFAQVKGTD